MKKLFALLLLLAAPSWAAVFSGTIARVATRTFTVTKGDQKMTFKIEDGTRVVVDGKTSSPDRLRVGQKVTVDYEARNGEATARSVEAETPKDKERKENKP